ncbi:hypothetical protein GCK32_009811, partial [Trichostrongylus colubriformis]
MIESTSAENHRIEDVMIPTTKRCIPLPFFKGNMDKLLWVVFPPSKSEIETAVTQEFFCIVGLRDLMFIATNDSHPLGFRVQFDIHAVHATKFGLLVERDLSLFATSAEDQVALYSLSHPLNELLAVIFKPRDSLTQWLFCWEKSEYLVIGAEHDLLLVFDKVNEVHSLLRIRITSEHEVQSAIELLEKRRTEATSTQGTPLIHPESTPITAHRLQSSGASMAAPRIHAGSAVTGGGSLIRSVHTRSMTARLARTRSFPHPPHAPPADSPALSIFSPMSLGGHSEAGSTAISQVYDPVHQMITPRIQVFSRELQRQPDFDLLLAELCLDHVWTEPSKRDVCGEIAIKMFLSHNALSQDFVNFFVGTVSQLRTIRVVHTVGNITTSGSMNTLSCRDAAAVRGGDLTAVLEMDNSIGLYSGYTRCAVAVISRFTITPSTILYSADNSSFVIQHENKLTKAIELTRVILPSVFVNPLARDLFAAVVDVLPREKALRLMLDWKTSNRSYEMELGMSVTEPQLHTAIRFILEQSGIVIEEHKRLPWRKRTTVNEDFETDAKQRRPKASAEENWNRLLTFYEATTATRQKFDGKSERTPVNVVVKIDSTAPLHGHVYAVIGAIHASFEEWSLDCGLFHLKSRIVYYLHAATSVLGLKAYSSQYMSEFIDCSDCVYEVQRNDG